VSEKTEIEKKGLSRREFLKDAGLVVGGATVGSMAFLNSCKATTTETTTITSPPITTTATVSTYIDPIDGTTYSSMAALKAHFNAVHPHGDATLVAFTVNGKGYAFQVKPYTSLGSVLREGLGLFGLKLACGMGECGACTVIVDGLAVHSCAILAVEMEGRVVQTIEGLSNNGVLNPVQQKYYDNEGWACGFCTPGFVMAAQALINVNPHPTLSQVQLALSGHQCMCGNNHRAINAIVGGI